MVYSTIYAFDMYYLFVEVVFGNLFLTWLGLLIFFFAIGMFARMSATSLLWFAVIFTAAYTVGSWGDIGAIIVFVLAATWMVFALYRFYKYTQVYT